MEVSSSIFTIFLIFLPLLLAIVKNHNNSKKLPPGPWKLPIIGNLHQLGISRPYITLKELSKKYGPLMHLKLGERSTIVISSYKILKELLKTSDTILSHRPELLVSKTVAYNGGDIAFAPYGDYWKQMRKICTSELLSTKRIHSNYPLMEEEISRLVKNIKESSSKGPLAIPRESIEEIAINGYVIPNKTIVLMNLYAMGRDPEYWRDPEKFIPNRFNNYVDNDVDDVKMIKGSSNVPMEFLGFGFG
uniref:Cytochrome P450 n=1 Tax=Solanum tuberosum TaxID=4113 RepID=M1DKL2_SOLTU